MSLKPIPSPPIVWSIGGSDSCSGGGIQADLKTMTTLGAHCCTVVTAITAQNSYEIQSVDVCTSECLQSQLLSLQREFKPQAIKVGMLGSSANIEAIVKYLEEFPMDDVVCDPVLASSSGTLLLGKSDIKTLKDRFFPLVKVLTPNLPEAELLTGLTVKTPAQIERAAKTLLGFGIKSVLIKGGHANGGLSQDFWMDGGKSAWLHIGRLELLSNNFSARGTGCTFASALAVAIAFGFNELDAAIIAKTFVSQSLRLSKKIGSIPSTPSILQYGSWPSSPLDFPWLTPNEYSGLNEYCFPSCGPNPIGLYPVIDRADWLKRLLPLGVKTVQIRIKDLHGYALEKEIQKAVSLSQEYQCRLFVNDFWEIALQQGAYGIHLGQEDLETAQIKELSKANIRLGLSTHCYSEVARAHSIRPSYLAIGPIFPTTIKSMRFSPQGVDAFRMWKQLLNYRLVAIGGITLETADELVEAGADGIAVVSDITKSADPESRVRSWLNHLLYSKVISANLAIRDQKYLSEDHKSEDTLRKAIIDLREGRFCILFDDEGRENEGDLVLAAEFVTPEAINFMSKNARGIICLTLTPVQANKLGLALINPNQTNTDDPAFLVSIDSGDGLTSGISASDRCHTIQVAIAENANPGAVKAPGHVFPLRAAEGGLRSRKGHTEGSIELMSLAGLRPAAVIVEILNDDGSVARLPELSKMARTFGIQLIKISDILSQVKACKLPPQKKRWVR